MASPSIQELEKTLFLLCQERFTNAEISPVHPKDEKDIERGEFNLVINYVSDSVEGRYISNLSLSPRVSFTVYATDYPLARNFGEEVVEFLDNLESFKFDWDKQRVEFIHKLNRTPVM